MRKFPYLGVCRALGNFLAAASCTTSARRFALPRPAFAPDTSNTPRTKQEKALLPCAHPKRNRTPAQRQQKTSRILRSSIYRHHEDRNVRLFFLKARNSVLTRMQLPFLLSYVLPDVRFTPRTLHILPSIHSLLSWLKGSLIRSYARNAEEKRETDVQYRPLLP